MSKPYENGTRAQITLLAIRYAIRDQEVLIDAHTPYFGEPDADAKKQIAETESYIRDFKRLARSIRKS